MHLNRRQFVLDGTRLVGGAGVTLAATGASLPAVLARTAAAVAAGGGRANRAGWSDPAGRILVMIQLTGGNDGLNTVIPYRDDRYPYLRPTLGVPVGQALKLDDDVGLAPQLDGLKALFDEGWLSVVQGVGYPNANRSHFQSMDIWHSADPTLTRIETGWLGRTIEADPAITALHVDDDSLPLALRAASSEVPSIRTIEAFRLHGGADGSARRAIDASLAVPRVAQPPSAVSFPDGPQPPSAVSFPDGPQPPPAVSPVTGPPSAVGAVSLPLLDNLQFIRRTAVAACENARRLESLPNDSLGRYPGTGLARRLREIARLIAADFGPRIYYTSLGGFDTHARQNTVHPNLLTELGGAVKAFFNDLAQRGLAQRVVLMTFSEFGRRAAENASLGTDHGAAAPLFVAGPALAGGVLGPRPDLSALVDDDVPYAIDFRSVYATVLERWLSVAAEPILGRAFAPIGLFR